MGGFQSSLSSFKFSKEEPYEVCKQKCSDKERKKREKQQQNNYVVVGQNQQASSRIQPRTTTPFKPTVFPKARETTKPYNSPGFGSLGGGGRKKKINRKSSKKRKLKKNKKKSLKRKK